jgi:hypothetical protein
VAISGEASHLIFWLRVGSRPAHGVSYLCLGNGAVEHSDDLYCIVDDHSYGGGDHALMTLYDTHLVAMATAHLHY